MLKEIDEIYNKTGDVVPMAVTHLCDIGFRAAIRITDKDIESLEENGLMTKEFVQDLVRTSREIANVCGGDPINLVMYCQKKKLFDVKNLNHSTKIEVLFGISFSYLYLCTIIN